MMNGCHVNAGHRLKSVNITHFNCFPAAMVNPHYGKHASNATIEAGEA